MFFHSFGMPHLKLINICGNGSSSVIYKLLNTKNGKYYALKEEKLTSDDHKTNDIINIGLHANIRQYSYMGYSQAPLFKGADTLNTRNAGYNYFISPFYKYTLRDVIQIRNDYFFGSTEAPCPLIVTMTFVHGYDNKIDRKFLLSLFLEIAKGALFLHANNKIHRDLKPENIFILNDKTFVPEIGDFGLVKDVTKKTVNYSHDVGTVAYIAPETRTTKYSFKVDVYALGLIYFELLCPMKTQMERIKSFEMIREQHRVPETFRFQYPEESVIIEACISKSEKIRLSARELVRNLLRMLEFSRIRH